MSLLGFILTLLVACFALIFIVVPLMKGIGWMIGKAFQGIGWLIAHVFRFVVGMIGDTLRIFGALIMSIIFVPLVVVNIVIGHWSAAAHFGRCFQDEIKAIGHSIYRVAIGHPARFLLLHPLTEGLEQRLPHAMAQAPGRDRPTRATGTFQGYTIVGSLKGGGSGGRLYIAEPDDMKLAAFARNGLGDVDQVVIKSFSLKDGSSLPQIIRESRALEAAKKLGFVLEHDQTADRFFYVMPYVPGDNLTTITQRLHVEAGPQGFRHAQLHSALSLISDLLVTLDHYHQGGLWHKDIKPDNIIVGPDGRAHLVDLGLITPLRSAMTLTTHGTEYFRDPELVRMALKGVKVHEVDGVKFDIYGAGAVLYSVIENSFPAHGGLSQIEKNCPEALRWIVRRAMADLNKRYASAAEMLADLRVVAQAEDPFLVRPADLPSVKGDPIEPVATPAPFPGPVNAAPPPVTPRLIPEPAAAAQVAAPPAAAPRLRVLNWFTGGYLVDPQSNTPSSAAPAAAARAAVQPVAHQRPGNSRPAPQQLREARQRVRSAQKRARTRMRDRRTMRHAAPSRSRYNNGPNIGVAIAAAVFLAFVGAIIALFVVQSSSSNSGSGYAIVTDGRRIEVSPLVRLSYNEAKDDVISYFVDEEDLEMEIEHLDEISACDMQGRVLVINKGEADNQAFRWMMNRFAALGYEPWGYGNSEAEIDLQARVLQDGIRGYDIDSPEVADMLRSWLVRTDADFEYALLVPSEENEEWRLVRGSGVSRDEVEDLVINLNR